MISLTHLEIVDLALRFVATGQLILLMFWFAHSKPSAQKRAYQCFLLCIISYILLTTPIANEDYGWLRRPLLLMTDLTAFAVWFLTLKILKPSKSLHDYTKWVTWPVALWCTWLAYFFLFTPAKGFYHDVNHVIGFTILAFVVLSCIHGFFDDLVDERRRARLIIIAGCSIYMGVLTLFELAFISVKDNSIFSLLNALIIALLSGTFTFHYIKRGNRGDGTAESRLAVAVSASNASQEISHSGHTGKLAALMESGIYKQPSFSIGALSDALELPEHQLRKVINQELGFSNFSHYLNSYRIPEVCRKLEDPKQRHVPILTLALEAGFNSIAPFNRAFKHHLGITPKQYREQFQK
ncbi:helix-turn-helix domain-containing protein [Alteromonas gracilis]|uniref:helix-turn-helix domain-containing protein n=1 Tax=Alteromonas gracilis TaxID=1479524 RepID=UPI00373674A2